MCFHKLHKSWKVPLIVSYQEYTQEPNLCVLKTLDECIYCTEDWRSGDECSQVLLSSVNPDLSFVNPKPVAFSTISDWLKNVLRKAGTNIVTFKTHSTRSVYTYNADLSGALFEENSKRGLWSNKSIWQKFCNKTFFKRVNYLRRWYLNKPKLLQCFKESTENRDPCWFSKSSLEKLVFD